MKNFPGDFIAEYIAQTRGWFYTLHVISTAMFEKPAFKNVVCTGTILAADGQKMSKSKNNFPDPTKIFEKYGADAMRFYLMSSSVMNGENFNFDEKGVAEILKTIFLPLESAYKFFSTYANIDNFSPTKIFFVRHGYAQHNEKNIFSGKKENPHELTEKGKSEILDATKKISDFDILFSSPFLRTKQTAEIFKKEKKFGGKIFLDDRVGEMGAGNLEGKKVERGRKWIFEKSAENIFSIEKRMQNFVAEIAEKFRGKKILVASHGAPIEILEFSTAGILTEKFFQKQKCVKNGEIKIFVPPPKTTNELDLWIFSELQILIKNFRANFDNYKIVTALAEIPKFIDNLNNWFLRRSRARFWKSEIDADKISGFETLHFVLLNLSKILAPVAPFFAEKLFQNLIGEKNFSVHLEFFPNFCEKKINKKLSRKIFLTREIVKLAAAVRARKKIKLRQPLEKLQFFCDEKILFDEKIIAAEANVENVEKISEKNLAKIARKILKIDARKCGKKFGKKIQKMIAAAKNGEFEILKNGDAKICGEILEPTEFSFQFLTDAKFDADATENLVVILSTEISENLRASGAAREIIREIQNLRKSKNFEISDRIEIFWNSNSDFWRKIFAEKNLTKKIATEVLAEKIAENKNLKTKNFSEIDGEKIFWEIFRK